MDPCISFDHISFGYDKREPLLADVNWVVYPGEFVYLTGPSGAGKSTILRLLSLAVRPMQGSLLLFGQHTRGLNYLARQQIRQRLGIVFQDFRLIEDMSILENVALPLKIRGLSTVKSLEQSAELLRWVGLQQVHRFPSSLSGGEKQRVAIARAVIARPKILLADEPTGNIDDETALKLFYLFEELHKVGTTIIFATHSHILMERFPHPVFEIRNGRIMSKNLTPLSQVADL
jgi:cell division transport system ATP-binding protein